MKVSRSFLILGVLLLSSIALYGCTAGSSVPSVSPSPTATLLPSATVVPSNPNAECQVDADCVTSGCGGTLCQPKSAPSGITTCEYRNEYACYTSDGCLCKAGKCGWSESTIQCLQDFNKPPRQTEAENACQSACINQKASGQDLSAGPCLSNEIVPGWVCDVAHQPRQDAIDNDPANTCPAYGGAAKHFVEVDGNCQLIQAA